MFRRVAACCPVRMAPGLLVAVCCIFPLAGSVVATALANDASTSEGAASDDPAKALGFQLKDIDGNEVSLEKYKGRVVMVVNVASQCGLTPQYEQLQALHKKYADQGLAIIAFPCNQFGQQEPGTEEEIKSFCTKNYGVEFDMFSKVNVNGPEACDLYKYLTSVEAGPKGPGAVSWNFEKFVIDRQGKVVARFAHRTKPDAEEVVSLLEQELGKK